MADIPSIQKYAANLGYTQSPITGRLPLSTAYGSANFSFPNVNSLERLNNLKPSLPQPAQAIKQAEAVTASKVGKKIAQKAATRAAATPLLANPYFLGGLALYETAKELPEVASALGNYHLNNDLGTQQTFSAAKTGNRLNVIQDDEGNYLDATTFEPISEREYNSRVDADIYAQESAMRRGDQSEVMPEDPFLDSKEAWKTLPSSFNTVIPEKTETPKVAEKPANIDQLAEDTIAGKYGNGEERVKALGPDYPAVQKRVNELAAKNSKDTSPNFNWAELFNALLPAVALGGLGYLGYRKLR